MNRYFTMSRYFTMMLGVFLAGACVLEAQNGALILEDAKQAYSRIKGLPSEDGGESACRALQLPARA